MSSTPGSETGGIEVRDLLAESTGLGFVLAGGATGLDRIISYPRIQKAALAVTGHVDSVRPGRVQLLGNSEMQYLRTRRDRTRAAILHKICSQAPVTCFVITGGREPPAELLSEAEVHSIAVLTTQLRSSACIDILQRFLDERLAPRTSVHGVLIDVYGLGVLMLGESGIGKSECGLDLITRGHRLVADDVVEIRRESSRVLSGSGPDLTQYHLEIRGLGLINIADLFGVSSIRKTKLIELVILLEHWQKGIRYDRLGLDELTYAILDVTVPLIRMPVAPGRNTAMLVEVAARNQLLKMRGFHAARRLADRLQAEIDSHPVAAAGRQPIANPDDDSAEGE